MPDTYREQVKLMASASRPNDSVLAAADTMTDAEVRAYIERYYSQDTALMGLIPDIEEPE